MSNCHISVTDPARRAAFEKIFGSAVVPVKSPATSMAEVEGLGQQPVYQLDLEAIGPDARARLAEHLAAKFGAGPDLVEKILAEQGLAILAEGCIVAIQARLF